MQKIPVIHTIPAAAVVSTHSSCFAAAAIIVLIDSRLDRDRIRSVKDVRRRSVKTKRAAVKHAKKPRVAFYNLVVWRQLRPSL